MDPRIRTMVTDMARRVRARPVLPSRDREGVVAKGPNRGRG